MRISLSELDFYMFVDPAGKAKRGEGLKKSRPRQAIVVLAADWLTRVFVFYAWAGNLPPTAFMEKIIDVYSRYSPRICGIEANAMQELFAELVKDEATRRLGTVRMRPINQDTHVDKDWRIRTTLEPVVNQGRLFLLDGNTQIDLENEVRSFPTGKRKDIVDALASAVKLIPARNQEKARDDEVQGVLEYLRETGAPSWYIEQRDQELRQEAKAARRIRG